MVIDEKGKLMRFSSRSNRVDFLRREYHESIISTYCVINFPLFYINFPSLNSDRFIPPHLSSLHI